MPTNILSSLMSAAASAGQVTPARPPTPSSPPQTEDPRLREERAAIRKLADKAAEENNTDALKALQPYAQRFGIDLGMYSSNSAAMTSEERLSKQLFNKEADALRNVLGINQKDPVDLETQRSLGIPPPPLAPIKQPQPKVSSAATGQGSSTQSTQPQQPTIPEDQPQNLTQPIKDPSTLSPNEIIRQDLLLQAAAKNILGITIDEHTFSRGAWLQEYDKLVSSGTPSSMAVQKLASEFGFIPDEAANLKELSKTEREGLFNQFFTRTFFNPKYNEGLKNLYPNAVDPQTGQIPEKLKAGMLLNQWAVNGGTIPERYQDLYDRYLGLANAPVAEDTNQAIYMMFGKNGSDASPEEARVASQVLYERDKQRGIDLAVEKLIATRKAEYEVEKNKPIAPEDKAKYGIGSEIITYQDLANRGVRFATPKDQEDYKTLSSALTNLLELRKDMFGKNGIFTGVGDRIDQQAAAMPFVWKDRAMGNERGRKIRVYNTQMAVVARELTKMISPGEGRLSDQDIILMKDTIPFAGSLLKPIDGEKTAEEKLNKFVIRAQKALETLRSYTTVVPMGQPQATTTPTVPKINIISKTPPK